MNIKKIIERVKIKLAKLTDKEWQDMFDHWVLVKNKLVEELESLGAPPKSAAELREWKKKKQLILLNLKVLDENAIEYTEKNQ